MESEPLVPEIFSVPLDSVAAMSRRGFILGTAGACGLSAGVGLARDQGDLPSDCVSMSYDLEYGRASLEMRADAIKKGQRGVICDDVLATGGTMRGCCDLVKNLGG